VDSREDSTADEEKARGSKDGSKRSQPQMTQINADELKKSVKLSGIPSSSSAVDSSSIPPSHSPHFPHPRFDVFSHHNPVRGDPRTNRHDLGRITRPP
jgi:hypothetical protein